MQRSVWILTLLALATATARADETIGERTDRAVDALGDAADDVKESAGEVAEVAGEKTRDVAREVAAAAKALLSKLGAGTREHAQKAGDQVESVLERGKSAASDLLSSVRKETRALLIDAAEALDEATREARTSERREHWQALKARLSLPAERPSDALSEELRDHAYRMARLERTRVLAQEADDEASIARSDRLIELEQKRHALRLDELRRQEHEEAKR